MLSRILTVILAFAILVTANKFLIGPFWGELVLTAVVAGTTTYILGKLGSGSPDQRP
ncbi:hypothetical protein [Streptomyces sp. NPDC087297]|uniref:hypothetical protein n=1 Tax=Streptomyces sp. NPDC087297 TaxID=3365778 RepID=UPI0038163512